KKFCYSPMNENESMSFVGEPTPRLYLLKGGLYQENDNALEECLAAIDSYARTMAAVEKLPPEQRSVIELYANGWTYAEIAELQGLPAGTVRSRLHYARKKLEVLRNESN
ncbi:MAG: sigma-70 family RNA polymerase sigma factor, partial [Candidatus Obscuribacterales bacterium]|nr:sigma-70 family RNA polymerase sigma factor [Candidatus Obscuribacterales bacterium]